MRICKLHGCDITWILIGYVLSDARFDGLVGNVTACKSKNQKGNKQHFPSFQIIFEKYFVKSIDYFFRVYIASSKHLGSWKNFQQFCKPETQSRVFRKSRILPSPIVFRRGDVNTGRKSPLLVKYDVHFSRYSKTENLADHSSEMLNYSHLLTEPPCNKMEGTHSLLERVEGFDKIHLNLKKFPFVIPTMAAKICILERHGWRKSRTERTWTKRTYNYRSQILSQQLSFKCLVAKVKAIACRFKWYNSHLPNDLMAFLYLEIIFDHGEVWNSRGWGVSDERFT